MNGIIAGCGGIVAGFLMLVALHHLGWLPIDPMLAARDLISVIRHTIGL